MHPLRIVIRTTSKGLRIRPEDQTYTWMQGRSCHWIRCGIVVKTTGNASVRHIIRVTVRMRTITKHQVHRTIPMEVTESNRIVHHAKDVVFQECLVNLHRPFGTIEGRLGITTITTTTITSAILHSNSCSYSNHLI